ncbi:MAG: ATP-binding protein [Clostridia bacterium]|nr:ATP-binding protein [Clostridia bacterium]
MRIIGRKKERALLEHCARTKKSELICVYGRRRVGKTFLVEQMFSEAFAFQATGVESGNTRDQLKAFHQRLRAYGDRTRAIPANWFEAFARLENILRSENVITSPYGKKIIFLDEFPWFATPRSDFLMAFGEFWNRYASAKGDICLIACGSATSWIIGNMIEATGTLYDRVTCQIYIHPFTLRETEQFFQDREFGWSRKQIAQCQMIFGGLPYFFDLLNQNESLIWNIDTLCFQKNALLQRESSRLLEATLKKSDVYPAILSLLAKHEYGLERDACKKQLQLADGTFSRAVSDLEKCGYIMQIQEMHRKNHPYRLRLIDPFLLFHFQFLSSEGTHHVQSFFTFSQSAGNYTNWRGHAFENLCLYHIPEIKRALGISGVEVKAYPWVSERKSGGAQIDLVLERADQLINLCEIKFTDTPFKMDATYEQSLLHKISVYQEETKTTKPIRLVLISAEGLAGTAYTEKISGVITLNDIFDM